MTKEDIIKLLLNDSTEELESLRDRCEQVLTKLDIVEKQYLADEKQLLDAQPLEL